jgi:hypothetical protein
MNGLINCFELSAHDSGIYNLLFGACACAFLRIGSNLVASASRQ